MSDPYAEFINARGRLLLGADGVPQIEITDRTPLRLLQPAWDDLRFPASGINPPGGENAATRSETTGLLEFAAAADNLLAFQVQLPHAWKQGSAVEPHVHWMPETTHVGNVVWKLEWKLVGINQTLPAEYSDDTITVAAGGVANVHKLSDFAAIDLTGQTVSTMLVCILSRLGADDADTFTGKAILLEIDFHYQIDGFGSVQEYIK